MSTRKLKLDVDGLEVESFAPAVEQGRRGTVHGHFSNGTFCYYSCNCANDSAAGYASCGTTCQEPTNCFGYCTDENCVESNQFSCGCPPGGGTGATCGCPPAETSPRATCMDA